MSSPVSSFSKRFCDCINDLSQQCVLLPQQLRSKESDASKKVNAKILELVQELHDATEALVQTPTQFQMVFEDVSHISQCLGQAKLPKDFELIAQLTGVIQLKILGKSSPSKIPSGALSGTSPSRDVRESERKMSLEKAPEAVVPFPNLLKWANKAIEAAKNGDYGDDTESDFSNTAKAVEDMPYVLRLTFVEWLRQSSKLEDIPEFADQKECAELLEQVKGIRTNAHGY